MDMWIGVEKEGNLIDIKTLFIGNSSITVQDIIDVLIEHNDIKQLYFGAGGLTNINEDVVKECIKKYPGMIITLEVTSDSIPLFDDKLLKQVYLMITIEKNSFTNLKDLDNDMYQIKLQSSNKFIGIGEITQIINTKELKGKMYEEDIQIK